MGRSLITQLSSFYFCVVSQRNLEKKAKKSKGMPGGTSSEGAARGRDDK